MSAPPVRQARLDASTLLQIAQRAEQVGDVAFAERALRALLSDRRTGFRNEARFRLARIHASRGEWTAGAVLLRHILDDEPASPRVRLELAGLLTRIGDEPGARRELRAAQAARPPARLARLIDQYAATLRDRRPFGAAVKVAVAPDSNISGSTGKDRLETVIGDFIVDNAARARSGVGFALEGSAFGRIPLSEHFSLVAQGGARSLHYKEARFKRQQIAFRGGGQVVLGRDRLSLSIAHQRHRVGSTSTLTASGLELDLLHQSGSRTQGRLSAGLTRLNNHLNDLEDGRFLQLGGEVEHALSPRTSLGMSLSGGRRWARDPAYSSLSAELGLSASREIGRLTVGGSATAGWLRADERLALFPERRRDRGWSLGLGVTSRHISWRGLSPSFRFTLERSRSNIAIYDTRRRAVEVGLTSSF
jgi:hypothetical protein